MDIQTLRHNLAITDGQVQITAATVPTAAFATLFSTVFSGKTIGISAARPGPDDGGNTVQVEGVPTLFLNTTATRILATFVLDPASGDVSADLRYTLPLSGTATASQDWTFRTSFPDLPTTFDFSSGLQDAQTSPLDDLHILAASFHACTHAGQVLVDTDHGPRQVPLVPGLNWVGTIRPATALRVFESLFAHQDQMVLAGPITLSGPSSVPALTASVNAFPWDAPVTGPGISLAADLGLEVTLSDKLALKNTDYRVFSPLTAAFVDKNPTHGPQTAFSCDLFLPSANMTLVKLASVLPKGVPEVVITADFDLSLDTLADLVDLAGTASLKDMLPEEIRNAASGLGKITLRDAAIAISGDGGISVKYVYLTIGLPDVNWSVGNGAFVFNSIEAAFIITDPLRAPKPSVAIDAKVHIDGAPVDISAGYPDFFITGTLEEKQQVGLDALMKTYLPGVPPPSPLTIDTLIVNVQPGQSFSFTTTIATEPSWHFDLGKNGLTISDVEFSVAKAFGGAFSGEFRGTLKYNDDITLSTVYTVPGNFVIRAEFPKVTLSGLIGWLVNAPPVTPGGFDLEFLNSTLVITRTQDKTELFFGTELEHFGSLCFVLRDEAGTWGFALGLDMQAGELYKMPGLEALKPFCDAFPFSDMLIAISTMADPGFTFPEMSIFNNPDIKSKTISLPKSAGGTKAGFYFFARTDFSRTNTLRNVATLMGIPPQTEIDAGVFVGENPATNSSLSISVTSTLQNGTTLTGTFGAGLQGEELALWLKGTVTTAIQGQTVQFDATLLVVENGAFISGDMIVTGGRKTLNFSVFQLHSLALEAGISFEELPSLGFAAQLDIADVDSSIAVFIDTENPGQSMAAGSVSNLTLKTIADELSGNNDPLPQEMQDVLDKIGLVGRVDFSVDLATYAKALDTYDLDALRALFAEGKASLPASSSQILLVVGEPGRKWYVTDMSTMTHYELLADGTRISVALEPQFYCVPEPGTQIAAIPFPQGMRVSGTIEYIIITAFVNVDVILNKGIGVDVEISPTVVGSADLLSITGADGKGGPKLVLCTFSDPTNINPNYRTQQFIVSGQLDLLGLMLDIDISVSAKGLHFHIEDKALFGSRFNLKADITAATGMDAGGTAVVGVADVNLGALGTVHVGTDVSASLDFGVTAADIYAHGSFDLELLGYDVGSARFDFDVATAPLQHLPALILAEIEKGLKALFTEAKHWLTFVYHGLVKGFEAIEDVGRMLADYFKLAYKEAGILMQAVGYAAEEVVEVLTKAFDVALDEAEAFCKTLYEDLVNCASKTALLAS